MARMTALEREMAAHRVDLRIVTPRGVAESHRMQSWQVSARAGELAGAYRDRTGSLNFRLHVQWCNNPNRDGQYLIPPQWRA